MAVKWLSNGCQWYWEVQGTGFLRVTKLACVILPTTAAMLSQLEPRPPIEPGPMGAFGQQQGPERIGPHARTDGDGESVIAAEAKAYRRPKAPRGRTQPVDPQQRSKGARPPKRRATKGYPGAQR